MASEEGLMQFLAQQSDFQKNAIVALTQAVETMKNASPASKPVPIRDPPTFSGDREELESFLGHVMLIFTAHPDRFPDQEARVLYLASLLRGPAFDWFKPLLETKDNLLKDVDSFVTAFRAVFGDARTSEHRMEHFLSLKQVTSVSRFFTDFVRLRSNLDVSEAVAISAFRSGLKPAVHDEVARILTPFDSVRQLAEIAIRIDNAMDRRRTRPYARTYARPTETMQYQRPAFHRPPMPTNDGSVPMEIDSVRRFRPLNSEETERRRHEGLCLYCGEKGHVVRNCQKSRYYNAPSSKNE